MRKYLRSGLTAVLVAVLVGLIVRNLEWEEYTAPAELRGDAARDPFYAAERLARSLGALTERRYVLGALPPPPAVLVLQRWQWNLIVPRRIAIERWVEAGGRLVVDERLVDRDKAFRDWTGLSVEYTASSPGELEDEAVVAELLDDPLDDEGCRVLTVAHDVSGDSKGRAGYRLCTGWAPRDRLTSARAPRWSLEDRIGMQAVRVALGRGSVTSINDAVFGNRELATGEHGLLFVAMTQLRAGDRFIFLSESGHPSLLALIWKHGAAVVVLAALALLVFLWRSGVRFGPPAAVPELARRSLVEQIRGTGLFVRRFGNGAALHAAALRAVYEAAQRRIPHWSSLPEEQRMRALAHAADVSPADMQDLLRNDSRSNHELKRALEQLERVRRQLMEKSGAR